MFLADGTVSGTKLVTFCQSDAIQARNYSASIFICRRRGPTQPVFFKVLRPINRQTGVGDKPSHFLSGCYLTCAVSSIAICVPFLVRQASGTDLATPFHGVI